VFFFLKISTVMGLTAVRSRTRYDERRPGVIKLNQIRKILLKNNLQLTLVEAVSVKRSLQVTSTLHKYLTQLYLFQGHALHNRFILIA